MNRRLLHDHGGTKVYLLEGTISYRVGWTERVASNSPLAMINENDNGHTYLDPFTVINIYFDPVLAKLARCFKNEAY